MRVRNVIWILVLQYLVFVVLCAFIEILYIGNTAREVQQYVKLAGNMALEQIQATDDFFLPSQGYMLEDTVGFKLAVPEVNGGKYKKVDIYSVMTGETEREQIFKKTFEGLESYIRQNPKVMDIEMSAAFWNSNAGNYASSLMWYKIPKIAQVGIDVTGTQVKKVKAITGEDVGNQGVVESIWGMYKLNDVKKFANTDAGVVDYYLTPLSLGITYVNPEQLGYLFMNNLDLLMRGKYASTGVALNTEEGGNGVLKGSTFAVTSDAKMNTGVGISKYNPINNGRFTLLRGEEKRDVGEGVSLFKGIEPKVTYKVIDMYDKRNDEILSYLFGAKPNRGGSKAEYFKELDSGVCDPATGEQVKSKPIVVAEVTFYADIIVPYNTVCLREMRAKVRNGVLDTLYLLGFIEKGEAEGNFVDLIRKGSGVSSPMGNNSEVFMYRQLYAVTP